MTSNLDMALIQKTPLICGGNARIRNTRIPVWTLVSFRKLGTPDSELLESYPSLTQQDLEAAWSYYELHQAEIEKAIFDQDADDEEY